MIIAFFRKQKKNIKNKKKTSKTKKNIKNKKKHQKQINIRKKQFKTIYFKKKPNSMGNNISFVENAHNENNNSNSITKYYLNFQDIQYLIKYYQSERNQSIRDPYLLINTLQISDQKCVIPYTLVPEKETEIINSLLSEKKTEEINIIVYGKNCNDFSVFKKQQQLQSLGFTNVFIYLGGMFEWLLLQDSFHSSLFPTTTIEKDLLVFMPPKQFIH